MEGTPCFIRNRAPKPSQADRDRSLTVAVKKLLAEKVTTGTHGGKQHRLRARIFLCVCVCVCVSVDTAVTNLYRDLFRRFREKRMLAREMPLKVMIMIRAIGCWW